MDNQLATNLFNAGKITNDELYYILKRKSIKSIIGMNGFVTAINNIDDTNISNKLRSDLSGLVEHICLHSNNSNGDTNNTNMLRANIAAYTQLLDENTYSSDQSSAVKHICNFLMGIEKMFCLFGFAGTGKTTILINYTLFLLENRMINNVVFVAPTNKAVNVMKLKFKQHLNNICTKFNINQSLKFDDIIEKLEDYNVVIKFMTIHRLLRINIDYDDDGNTIFLVSESKVSFKKYDMIVIDECSMI